MYKIKKSDILVAIVSVVVLSTASFTGKAAGSPEISYNSQGKIVFDNHTPETEDDVVFDASDFLLIDSMVADGKKNMKDELNEYDGIDISEDIPTFDTLVASIDAISEGTDAAAENILSGKKAIVGKSIVTGSMNDCSGRVVSTDKIVENGDNAEITISSGYYDEDSRISIPIETIIKEVPTINSNLSNSYKLYAENVDLPWTPPEEITDYIIVPTYVKCSGGGTVSGNNGSTSASCSVLSGSEGLITQQGGNIVTSGNFRVYCGAFNGSPGFSVNFTKGDIYVKS